MVTLKITTSSANVSESTLKLAPARVLTFLQGATEPGIYALFAPVGWDEAQVELAWSLLNEMRATSVVATNAPDLVLAATAACEAWQATGLVRARAMLNLTHPDQAAFLFHDLVPGKGLAAAFNVATFLERVHALDKSPERKATRADDHEALAILDRTGTTKAMRNELAAHVEAVHAAPDPLTTTAARAIEDKRLETLRKLHAWITAWTEIAHTAVTRKDQRIRLGLAKRRSAKTKPVRPVAAPAKAIAAPTPLTMFVDDEVPPASRAA